MKSLIVYIILALLLQACRVYPLQVSNTNPSITIDSTYNYYIREYYVEENNKRYDLTSKQDNTGATNKKLIEVEYLFVSNDGKNNVIYMTTVPDRRQQRYSENYLGRDSVNMHDVRMLHFGKITGQNDQFLFTDFKPSGRDMWKVEINNNRMEIKVEAIYETKNNELNQVMVVDSALASPLIFEKISAFHLVYYNPKKEKNGRAAVEKNSFYYNTGKPTEIIVYYDKEIADGKNVQRFPKKQVVYDPEKIFTATGN